MFKNYFKTALRGFSKNKLNTWISIAGLSIGLTAFIIIALFINDELSYDKFNKNKGHIYRIAMDMGPDFNNPLTPMPLAPALNAALPEIDKTVRIVKNRDAKALFVYNDKRFYETNFMYADSSVFNVFTFNFISGDPQKALTEPNTLIINKSTAQKYFGTTNALNKIIRIEGEDKGYKVTGIIEDIPAQSHFHFDFLLSFSSLSQGHKDNWLLPYMFTYILAKPNVSVNGLEKKIGDIIEKNFATQITAQSGMSWSDFQKKNGHGINIYLQSLQSIHLHSKLRVELEPNGNYKNVWLFGIIAILILILSCVNFINLATASASVRSKEIVVRKVVGAVQKNLISQFLFESFVQCLVSFVISLLLISCTLPFVNQLTGKELSLLQMFQPILVSIIAATLVLVALLSGSYPAFYLSALQPVKIFKKAFNSHQRGLSLRRVLIVGQFTISLTLIIGVIIVGRQVYFMNNSDLGFQKDQLVVLPLHANLSSDKKQALKNDILKYKAVQSVTMLNYLPGKEAYENQDVFIPQEKTKDQFVPLWYIRGDWDITKTMGFQLLTGRDFNPQMPTDSFGYILNETAVKQLGWKLQDAVGKTLSTFGDGPDDMIQGRVIGVVKDFHFEDFTNTVKPLLVGVNPHFWWNVAVRVDPENISATLSFLQKQWKTFQPDYPFEYYFEDQNFSKLWSSDQKLTVILEVFTGIAMGIACIGLFGLSVFAAERRIKEIGIRKVLGASVSHVAILLSKDFIMLVAVAILIATPLAWWAANNWLQGFAYRINISWWIFIVAGISAILIALLTVSFQAIKAAIANPVKSLRTE
ncbi:MAG: ABC transporter permease [Ginsengibacter sp.]